MGSLPHVSGKQDAGTLLSLVCLLYFLLRLLAADSNTVPNCSHQRDAKSPTIRTLGIVQSLGCGEGVVWIRAASDGKTTGLTAMQMLRAAVPRASHGRMSDLG